MMSMEDRAAFIADIASAIRMQEPVLTEEEQQWVRLAIQKEAQSIKLRQAIIEKTITALIWAGIGGFVVILKEFFTNHGWKP
jgi:hypothetical protein